MSTPCGAHKPVSPESFASRAKLWADRTKGTKFIHCDYKENFADAKEGDLIYCDPPYVDSQSILYGGQSFKLSDLFAEIHEVKKRGVRVALSIDGTKKSGKRICDIGQIPDGLFEHCASVNCGRSMLKRFQQEGQTLAGEEVTDRLLLTYIP